MPRPTKDVTRFRVHYLATVDPGKLSERHVTASTDVSAYAPEGAKTRAMNFCRERYGDDCRVVIGKIKVLRVPDVPWRK